MLKIIANVKFEEPFVRRTDGYTDGQGENMKLHTKVCVGGGGGRGGGLVPFRSAKYQFTGVISILRNGTEQT